MTDSANKIREMNNKLVENRQSEMKATVVNEQQKENKIKIDEKAAQATKINEENTQSATTVNQIDPFAPEPTNINEGEKEEADDFREAKPKSGKDKDIGKPEDEVYWKEADVIDTMWKDWFIAFFNYATNKAVHAVEYGFDAAYNAYVNRRVENKATAENKKDDKPKNNTEKLHKAVADNQAASSKDNVDGLVKDHKKITQMLQEGKVDEVSAEYAAIGKFFNTFPEIKAQMTPDNPNIELASRAAVALTKNIEIFSENYAQTKIMTDQMADKNRYKDLVDNPEQISALYQKEKKNAYAILQEEIHLRMTGENMTLDQALVAIQKDMNASAEIAHKNFKDGNYSDNGRVPKENPYLNHLTGLLANQSSVEQEQTVEHSQTEQERPTRETPAENDNSEQKKTAQEKPKEEEYAAPSPKPVKSTEETLDEIINSSQYSEEEKELALDMAIEEEKKRNARNSDKPRSMAEEAASIENSPLQKKYDLFLFQEQQLEGRAYDYSQRHNKLQKFKQALLGNEAQNSGNDNFIAPTYGVGKPKEEKKTASVGVPYSIEYLRGKTGR